MFNDRPKRASQVAPSDLPKPEISIVVDGNQIFKPGMKTVFVEDDNNLSVGGGNVVSGSYCSCNSVSVCTCNTVCTCQAVCTCEAVCSCVDHCSCNAVCTCEAHCSCNTVCTCQGNCTCNAQGGTYCSCVPVH